ncbi:MAG TPA: FAD-dependent oxidoreductase, partial [Anaeromyxobacteraceae bacterium]|nr:FAD-dependent oxidoreductase [Anaeromyxobacteraceae bacterium]
MRDLRDAVVVGGGPAGLAFALAAARRGLSVTVLERRDLPADKACGEGVLPAGVRALDALGVRGRLSSEDASAIREIRWIDRDGAVARLALPAPGGLGVRRIALSAALLAEARAAGAEVVEGAEVTSHRRERDGVVAVTSAGEVRGRVLVAADGLGSPVRRREGLDRPAGLPRRFGLRRHFAVPPWADAVEVHFADGAEAYVTPAGDRRVGVAFLFEREAREGAARADAADARAEPARFEDLLPRFPVLERLLAGATPDSLPRGAGPLARRAAARTADRLVLLGDAAGYVDALTGEGLSIAFGCAMDLAAILPGAFAAGAGRA